MTGKMIKSHISILQVDLVVYPAFLKIYVHMAYVSLQTARHIHTKTRTVTTDPNTIPPPAAPMIAPA